MSAGAWVLVVAVAAALAVGTYRLLTDGRFRGTHAIAGTDPDLVPGGGPAVERRESGGVPKPPSVTDLAGLDLQLGERATLLQFSSAFCAPCRTTRRTLADVAAAAPGVTHVEIDAEQHLEAVRALDVLRTPTTLVLDADGVEVTRASGAPRKEHVLAALGATVSD